MLHDLRAGDEIVNPRQRRRVGMKARVEEVDAKTRCAQHGRECRPRSTTVVEADPIRSKPSEQRRRYRRGPVYVKRLAVDAAATEDELRAITRDSMRLHAALTWDSTLPVESLPVADRDCLQARGLIADGRYRLPADFKDRPTEAGTAFSERSIIDQYVNAGTVGELTATVVLPGAMATGR